MATLAEMKSEVFAITNRYDLDDLTTRMVKGATLKAHQLDYFPRDLRDQGIQYIASDYYQTLDIDTLFPLWRSLKYFRKYDTDVTPQPDTVSRELAIITPDQVYDSYNIMKSDVVYQAGSNLKIRSSTKILYSIVGFYENPDLTYTVPSWISDKCPDAIVLEAARGIFKTIGYDDQAAYFEKQVREANEQLIRTSILANGY